MDIGEWGVENLLMRWGRELYGVLGRGGMICFYGAIAVVLVVEVFVIVNWRIGVGADIAYVVKGAGA